MTDIVDDLKLARTFVPVIADACDRIGWSLRLRQASTVMGRAADEIEKLRAEAAAQAAQSARQCRDLLRAEGEIALAYERGYDDAVRLMLSEA